MATTDSKEGLTLATLDDACILKILESLPLSDIRSCSQLCKRLQAVCSYDAQRKLRNETLEIEVSSKGYLQILCRNENVTFFNNFIRKLRICGEFDLVKWAEQDLLASFVQTRCHEKCTYEITISDGLDLIPYSEEIKSVLHNSEIVDFINGKRPGRDVSNFLNYCPNVTTLSVIRERYDEMIDEILRQQYTKLKHFHLEFQYAQGSESQLTPEDLKTFLLENSQIKCLDLSESPYSFDATRTSGLVKCIETVVDFAPNLEHFCFCIGRQLEDSFYQTFEYLEKLCDRSSFKSLELRIVGDILTAHTNRLATLRQLKKIHIDSIFELDRYYSNLRPFVHLKSIAIDFFDDNSDNTDASVRSVTLLELPSLDLEDSLARLRWNGVHLPPNIEELIMRVRERISEVDILAYIRYFVCKCNLKKLSVFNAPGVSGSLTIPLAKLDKARWERYEHPQPITIFTNFHGNTTNFDHRYVKLQCVECSSSTSQRYCMSSIE